MHDNSFSLSHDAVGSHGNPAGPGSFTPFIQNPQANVDPRAAQHDKDVYKAELRAQMEEKKAREAAEKQRRQMEDLREEERLKREREELHR